MTIASKNQNIILGIFLVSAGLISSFASCTDSYQNGFSSSASSNGKGASSGGGSTADGIDPTVNTCNQICRNDLKAIIDECTGEVQKTCTPDEGCSNHVCINNPCQAAEESKSSYGCDYWALKTAQRAQAQGACFAAVIANTWEKPVHINVEQNGTPLPTDTFAYIPDATLDPSQWPAYDASAGLAVGDVAILFLSRGPGGLLNCPRPAAVVTDTGVKGTGIGRAFHITTDYPVVAYQIAPYGGGMTSYSSATLLIPTSAWDTQYMGVSAYKASADPTDQAFPSMNILAKGDNTEVTITPAVDILAGVNVPAATKGVAQKYTLNAGEFLQITQTEELTGSSIKSNDGHPIAVFGASTCMYIPDNTQADCDSGQQQIAPFAALGNEYAAIRYKNRTSQEESPPWRLVGAADDTTLTWTPEAPPGAPMSLKAGQVAEFNAPGPFVVQSQDTKHAFYLGGYMTGGSPFMDIGDPEWVNVTPPSQYLNGYVFFTDPTYPETSLTVVRTPSKPDGKFADVVLECLDKPLDGWKPVGKYEYTRVDLVSGNFAGNGKCTNGRQKMTSALPFGVTVWGWGTTQQTKQVSYAYPAGAGFQPINTGDLPIPH